MILSPRPKLIDAELNGISFTKIGTLVTYGEIRAQTQYIRIERKNSFILKSVLPFPLAKKKPKKFSTPSKKPYVINHHPGQAELSAAGFQRGLIRRAVRATSADLHRRRSNCRGPIRASVIRALCSVAWRRAGQARSYISSGLLLFKGSRGNSASQLNA